MVSALVPTDFSAKYGKAAAAAATAAVAGAGGGGGEGAAADVTIPPTAATFPGNGEIDPSAPVTPLQAWDQVNSKALEHWATEGGKPAVNAVAKATECHLKRIPAEGFGEWLLFTL